MDTRDQDTILDSLIRTAMMASLDEIPVRGKAAGWEKVRARVYSSKRGRQSVGWTLRKVAIIACCLLVSAGLFKIPQVRAWSIRAVSVVLRQLPNESDEQIRLFTQDMKALAFKPLLIPSDDSVWRLTGYSIDSLETKDTRLMTDYVREDGASVLLRQWPAGLVSSSMLTYDNNDFQFLEKRIRDVDVRVFVHKAGLSAAWWSESGLCFHASGLVDVDSLESFIETLRSFEGGS